MSASLYAAGLAVAAIGAAARGVTVILAFVRTFLIRKQFSTFRFGWIEAIVSLEPLLLLGVAYGLFRSIGHMPSPTPSHAIACALGAGLVLAGWALVLWTFFSWPAIFAGHGVLKEHPLRTTGAYGVVRHPVYLGAVLIWLGLALAFVDALTFGFAIVYVIPAYLLYIRSEETMMLASFGEQYRDYQRRVPRLLPRILGTKEGAGSR